MAKIRTFGRWLIGEWPVPRWICLLFVIGAAVDLVTR
jgi:hypothetical protein